MNKLIAFKPMNPQPNWVFLNEGDAPDEYEPGVFVWYAPYPAGEDGGDVDWRGEFHKAPYRPGEKCYVREAWGVGSRPHPYEGCIDGIEYKADEQYLDEHDDLPLYQVKTPDGVDLCDYDSGWRSPVTMPQWAARRFVTVLSCEPVRVSEITDDDALAFYPYYQGIDNYEHGDAKHWFITDWENKHPGKWAWRVESEEAK